MQANYDVLANCLFHCSAKYFKYDPGAQVFRGTQFEKLWLKTISKLQYIDSVLLLDLQYRNNCSS